MKLLLRLRDEHGRYLRPSWLPTWIEVAGCVLVAAGIRIEHAYGAPVGYLLISEGSLALIVGGLWYAKLSRRARRAKHGS